MSLYKSFSFSEGGIWVAKIAFSLERLYYGRKFLTEFGGTFFCRLFAGVFLLRRRRKYRQKTPLELQAKSMKLQVKSVHKNIGKIKQNVDSVADLHLNRQS